MRLNHRYSAAIVPLMFAALAFVQVSASDAPKGDATNVDSLIEKGEYTAAEKLLRTQIADTAAPITSEPAVQLEILRRTRQDFRLTEVDVLAELQKEMPETTQADLVRWRDAGDLQSRMIDGERRYFHDAVPNLILLNKEAKGRKKSSPAKKKYDTTALVEKLVKLSESSSDAEIYPVKHHVKYEVAIKDKHPLVKPGAKVRAWLPYPQEYRQQRDVKLVSSSPEGCKIASKDAPQRTIYFEQTITDATTPPKFAIELEFVTSAYCPHLDAAKVRPYDVNSALYREYTAERRPHIAFTPEVKRLSAEIVGDEQNPLEKARKIFRWVSTNIPWCHEMEYSIIPSLAVKGLTARRGDCGVKGTSFITLCRAAGVPARWQSGWETKPGDWNMHDWSEFYVEPWGWLPADSSYGVRQSSDPRVRDFFCGNMDPYRMIVNLDYGRALEPPKTSFRSEPTDFQRGEIEIDGHNLYFDEWEWKFEPETEPLVK